MAFDAFFLSAVLDEVRERCIGARIDKIHQPSRDTLILHFKHREGRAKLLIAANPAAPRFNEAYRAMADHCLAWAEGAPAEASKAAFVAMGGAAPYRFDRRVLTCDMTFALPSPDRLTVTRTATLKSRRGELAERTITSTDSWRLPELTAVRSPKKRHKSHGKRPG